MVNLVTGTLFDSEAQTLRKRPAGWIFPSSFTRPVYNADDDWDVALRPRHAMSSQ
jgi:hypothetical protein